MGKYDSFLYSKDSVFIHYCVLLLSIHRIYYAATKMFKIYGSTAVDSNNDEDEMDYLL